MPVIKVWCLPVSSEETLNRIFAEMVSAVESVPELGLEGKDSMTILFPPDMMKFGLGTNIIIEVTGLIERPERTLDVQRRLAMGLGMVLKRNFPDAKVECFVLPFNTAISGFWMTGPNFNPGSLDN